MGDKIFIVMPPWHKKKCFMLIVRIECRGGPPPPVSAAAAAPVAPAPAAVAVAAPAAAVVAGASSCCPVWRYWYKFLHHWHLFDKLICQIVCISYLTVLKGLCPWSQDLVDGLHVSSSCSGWYKGISTHITPWRERFVSSCWFHTIYYLLVNTCFLVS